MGISHAKSGQHQSQWNSYQLEEPGYEQLRAYLERAESRLKDSPDRTEVMADLEQAVSEKCRATLGPYKTVVSTLEVERIISEMGPVESADEKSAHAGTEGDSSGATHSAGPPRKRLFRINEGAMWAGVCNGIGAYLNVDVTWVRIAFVLLTIFSSGLWFVGYLVLMFVMPVANTAEDRAAAFGMPFNTEELISRAKKNFEQFGQTVPVAPRMATAAAALEPAVPAHERTTARATAQAGPA